jgi:hypothetical protein
VRKDKYGIGNDDKHHHELELSNLSDTGYVPRKSIFEVSHEIKTERDMGATKITKYKQDLKPQLPPKKINNRNSQLNISK